jgi:hypothetical protein
MPSLFDDPQGEQPAEAAVPTRLCPHCSTQSQTAGEFCPHCGKSLVRRRRTLGRRGKLILAVIVVVVLGGGASTAVAMKVQHDDQAKAERARKDGIAEQERQRRERQERQQREEEERQSALDDIERESRQELEKGLRKASTKHAREVVAGGLLDGPILKTVCDPVGGGRDDLEAQTGKYECMAVRTENTDGTMRGYSYSGTINYDEFTYSWQLGD